MADVLITFKADKDGNQRPPFKTTDLNIPIQERLYGHLIDEIQVVGQAAPTVVKKIVPQADQDKKLVIVLRSRGKTAKAISDFLKIDIKIVENYIA